VLSQSTAFSSVKDHDVWIDAWRTTSFIVGTGVLVTFLAMNRLRRKVFRFGRIVTIAETNQASFHTTT